MLLLVGILKRKVEICVPTNSLDEMKKPYLDDWGASSVVFDLEDTMVSRVDTMINAHKNIVSISKTTFNELNFHRCWHDANKTLYIPTT